MIQKENQTTIAQWKGKLIYEDNIYNCLSEQHKLRLYVLGNIKPVMLSTKPGDISELFMAQYFTTMDT